jgi:hypothetical protein
LRIKEEKSVVVASVGHGKNGGVIVDGINKKKVAII